MADPIKKEDLNKQNPLGVAQPVRRPGANAGQQGTGFTNIQRVIGASQGNKLGSAVTSGVQKVGQNVKQNIAQSGQKFQQGVQGAQLNTQQNQQQSSGLVDRAAAGQNLSQQDLDQAETFRRGDYKGPMELENAAQLAGQGVEAETLGRLGSTAGGRQGLLQRFVGAPQYSAGQQKLDTLLLGGNKEALSGIRGSVRGLGDEAIKAVETARGQAQQAGALNKQFGADFLSKIAGRNTDIDTAIGTALSNAQAAENARSTGFKTLSDQLKIASQNTGGFAAPPDVAGMINNNTSLRAEQKTQLANLAKSAQAQGLNPSNVILSALSEQQAQGLNKTGVMSEQQLASMNALAKLAGRTPEELQGVGAFKAGGNAADVGKVQGALDKFTNAGIAADPKDAGAYGIDNMEIINNVLGSPDASFKNRNVVAAMLTPEEMKLYDKKTNPLGGNLQKEQLKTIMQDRARRNQARLIANQQLKAQAKDAFNRGF
jgi:hypothetical protein